MFGNGFFGAYYGDGYFGPGGAEVTVQNPTAGSMFQPPPKRMDTLRVKPDWVRIKPRMWSETITFDARCDFIGETAFTRGKVVTEPTEYTEQVEFTLRQTVFECEDRLIRNDDADVILALASYLREDSPEIIMAARQMGML